MKYGHTNNIVVPVLWTILQYSILLQYKFRFVAPPIKSTFFSRVQHHTCRAHIEYIAHALHTAARLVPINVSEGVTLHDCLGCNSTHRNTTPFPIPIPIPIPYSDVPEVFVVVTSAAAAVAAATTGSTALADLLLLLLLLTPVVVSGSLPVSVCFCFCCCCISAAHGSKQFAPACLRWSSHRRRSVNTSTTSLPSLTSFAVSKKNARWSSFRAIVG